MALFASTSACSPSESPLGGGRADESYLAPGSLAEFERLAFVPAFGDVFPIGESRSVEPRVARSEEARIHQSIARSAWRMLERLEARPWPRAAVADALLAAADGSPSVGAVVAIDRPRLSLSRRVLARVFGALIEQWVRNPPPQGVTRRLEFRRFELHAALLVDRLEVTRRAWLAWLDSGRAPDAVRAAVRADTWSAEQLDLPVAFVSQPEAAAFAAWRGLRLLRAEEWILIAMGPRENNYPWGDEWQDSIANTLDLGLGRAIPVGTFPVGDSPTGIADLLGNVAEWTADRLPRTDVLPGDTRVSALGGSFLTRARRTYEERRFPLALALEPLERASDVGLRCAIEAEAFVFEHADGWSDEPRWRERLARVGERWGRAALRDLERWSERSDAPAAVALLLEGARRR